MVPEVKIQLPNAEYRSALQLGRGAFRSIARISYDQSISTFIST